jgi:hypothetical protein
VEQDNESWRRLADGARKMSPEELADLLASSYSPDARLADLGRGLLLAVLDTSNVRTGLHHQLAHGSLPASISMARDGSMRIFMEYETLRETQRKLPKFARQFGVPVAELTRILNESLPYTRVVKLPPPLRELDQRALEVRSLDSDDYPAAALAALLSPCILLTGNHNDFGPLGVQNERQGVEAVEAGIAVKVGEARFQASVMVPAAPVIAVGEITKWASEKIGPWACAGLALLLIAGGFLYSRQPEERRAKIRAGAVQAGKIVLDQIIQATTEVEAARAQLRARVIAGPATRSPESAIVRELALSEHSLSAQQLADRLDEAVRPPVAGLRGYLRASDEALVYEVRRGGFVLGTSYRLRMPAESAASARGE